MNATPPERAAFFVGDTSLARRRKLTCDGKGFDRFHVIASAAKQSSSILQKLDCFVANAPRNDMDSSAGFCSFAFAGMTKKACFTP
jgi:hypothetical protein